MHTLVGLVGNTGKYICANIFTKVLIHLTLLSISVMSYIQCCLCLPVLRRKHRLLRAHASKWRASTSVQDSAVHLHLLAGEDGRFEQGVRQPQAWA